VVQPRCLTDAAVCPNRNYYSSSENPEFG
jgi:hypothetical protein